MVFKCEYPDGKKYHGTKIFDGKPTKHKRTLRIVIGNDAPIALQMNWKNIVLWRMILHYPSQRSVGGIHDD